MDNMNKLMDKLIEQKLVEPSNSAWSSLVVMARKSNGTHRLCFDFKQINRVTKQDVYPLPQMTNILDKLQKANYIRTFDLVQAFHQVPLDEKSKKLTTFTVAGRGLFQFTRHNIERNIRRSPQMVKTGIRSTRCCWSLSPEKCLSFRSAIKYLGFLINNKGVKADPSKLAPILDLPAPRNIRTLRRFLGSAGWYRRFIPNFATVAEPLFRLLKRRSPLIVRQSRKLHSRRLKPP